LESLSNGEQPEPAAPCNRAEDARRGKLGAPLWKLCEFRDHVSAEARSGFEAALEAAGLLDAWVTPVGELIDVTTHDVFFRHTDGASDAGLNRVLRVGIDPADARASAITPQLVQHILGCIGSVEKEGQTWATAEGRWQHGLLSGAWAKPDAEYVGHAARENARRRRIIALESTLAKIDENIAQIRREQDAITARMSKLQAERDGAPKVEPLQRTIHALEAAKTSGDAARGRLEEVDRTLGKARESEQTARETRDRDATDLGLAKWKEPARVHDLEGLLADVRENPGALFPDWPLHDSVCFHAIIGRCWMSDTRRYYHDVQHSVTDGGTPNQNQFPLYHEEIAPSGSKGARTVRLNPRSQCTRTSWCFLR